jgi:UDP-4-amino-4-deoxy-L-arabinose-oxoglutarate aminotransferase
MIAHSKPWITEADQMAVCAVLKNGMIAQGALVERFEQAVAQYLDVPGAVAVSSGTAALSIALQALDIGSGDEVILPTYVCCSVITTMQSLGAIPVLCDTGAHWNLVWEAVEPRLSKCAKAILLPHIFGIAADTSSFMRYGLPVIEDCCQAFGARDNNRMVGSIGQTGFFSFHATKCLTTGEGGMVVSGDPKLVDKMRAIRDAKVVPAPMSDMQASLGLSQLSRYDCMLQRRLKLAQRYLRELQELKLVLPALVSPRSIFFRFPILTEHMAFEDLQAKFLSHGVAVRRGVDALLHRTIGLSDDGFPQSARLYDRTLSLPLYPALTDEEQGLIIRAAKEVLR